MERYGEDCRSNGANARGIRAKLSDKRRIMAGSILINPAIAPISVIGKRAPLANAAAAPRQAAAATAAAPAAAAAAPAAAPATTPAAAATASAAATATSATAPGDLYARLHCRGVFLVEDIEGRETDVGEFFLTERDLVIRRHLLQRHIRSRRAGRGRSSANAAGQ
jgi:hypothetical protein